MTLYAILQRPIGRILGWAIPDHIAKTSPLWPAPRPMTAFDERYLSSRARAAAGLNNYPRST